MTETKIILIDSNSLINRAFHALPPLQLADGMYTNAVFGYVSMLQKLISEEKPSHICAVFDCRAKTFRHLKYDGYKATRKPMAEELAVQIPVLQELLQKMGIKILFKEGVEADDIIGTLAKKFDKNTIIVSGDRDCLQLIDDSTTVYLTKRGVSDVIKYDKVTLMADLGFTPKQIIEYKGLAGDSSDNIPGASGVGPKTATDLLKQYEDIDGIYAHLDEIKGKLRERLSENREQVLLSRELATICVSVQLDCDLKDLEFNYPLKAEAYAMMRKLEFKKLTDRFKFETETEEISVGKEIAVENVSVNGIDELTAIVNTIKKSDAIAFNVAGNALSFCCGDKSYDVAFSVDLFGSGINDYDAFKIMKPFFGKDYKKVFYDVKQMKTLLNNYNIEIEQPYEDLLLKGYLLMPGRNIKDVTELLLAYGYGGKNVAAELLSLNEELDKKLQEMELDKLYTDLELPLIQCLYDMERTGFKIDILVLNELDSIYTEQIAKLLKEIYFISGEEFNVNSTKQLGHILFEKLQLPHTKKNKTGFSVSAEVLEELEHPIAEVLLRYRQITKLKSTYIDGMRSVINKKTGKVHTCFKQSLTTTGRLSSTEPNLQNIPVRRAEGREIRRMFIPSEKCVLVSADYSQIELRLLAHFSQDENLIEAFNTGVDVHSLTASKIFRVPLESVDGSMRSSAKAVNFGIIYGISSFGLAKNASVSNSQAKRFIDEYFVTYPKVKEYMDSNVKEAKTNGYLRTMLGRVRYFPELTSSQFNIRAFGERAAMNMPLQGSASDVIKLAMLKVDEELKKQGLNAHLILQVHDELIVDTPLNEEATVKKILKDCMENVVKLRVPLIVNVASGKNWFEAK